MLEGQGGEIGVEGILVVELAVARRVVEMRRAAKCLTGMAIGAGVLEEVMLLEGRVMPQLMRPWFHCAACWSKARVSRRTFG